MTTVSNIETFLQDHAGARFTAKSLVRKGLATSERSVNVAMKGAISKGVTTAEVDEDGKFFWPTIEPASNLGRDIPSDDSDIISQAEVIEGLSTPMPGTQYGDAITTVGNFRGDPIVLDERTGSYHIMQLLPLKSALATTSE